MEKTEIKFKVILKHKDDDEHHNIVESIESAIQNCDGVIEVDVGVGYGLDD